MKYLPLILFLSLIGCGPSATQMEEARLLTQMYRACQAGNQIACQDFRFSYAIVMSPAAAPMPQPVIPHIVRTNFWPSGNTVSCNTY
jgi:hypothetical protein